MTDTRNNPLAAELRQILADLKADRAAPSIRERLLRLTEHVERLATLVEVDASTELTASFGLEPDQEIRAQAAAIAGPPPVRDSGAMVAWDSAVVTLAAWIRTGERL